VKDRLALGIIEHAERTGALKPGQTVVEATSGNTGIAVAMVCAAKGYPCVVTMAESFSVERRKVMRMLGAKVILTPAAERGTGMVKKAKELADEHGWFLTSQFEHEANPEYHANTTGPEILVSGVPHGAEHRESCWRFGGVCGQIHLESFSPHPSGEIHQTTPPPWRLIPGPWILPAFLVRGHNA
jgi:cysteine synthase A